MDVPQVYLEAHGPSPSSSPEGVNLFSDGNEATIDLLSEGEFVPSSSLLRTSAMDQTIESLQNAYRQELEMEMDRFTESEAHNASLEARVHALELLVRDKASLLASSEDKLLTSESIREYLSIKLYELQESLYALKENLGDKSNQLFRLASAFDAYRIESEDQHTLLESTMEALNLSLVDIQFENAMLRKENSSNTALISTYEERVADTNFELLPISNGLEGTNEVSDLLVNSVNVSNLCIPCHQLHAQVEDILTHQNELQLANLNLVVKSKILQWKQEVLSEKFLSREIELRNAFSSQVEVLTGQLFDSDTRGDSVADENVCLHKRISELSEKHALSVISLQQELTSLSKTLELAKSEMAELGAVFETESSVYMLNNENLKSQLFKAEEARSLLSEEINVFKEDVAIKEAQPNSLPTAYGSCSLGEVTSLRDEIARLESAIQVFKMKEAEAEGKYTCILARLEAVSSDKDLLEDKLYEREQQLLDKTLGFSSTEAQLRRRELEVETLSSRIDELEMSRESFERKTLNQVSELAGENERLRNQTRLPAKSPNKENVNSKIDKLQKTSASFQQGLRAILLTYRRCKKSNSGDENSPNSFQTLFNLLDSMQNK